MIQHWVIAPVLLPFVAGVILLFLRKAPIAVQRNLSVLSLLAQVWLALRLAELTGDGSIGVYALGNWSAPWGIVLVADRLAAIMLLVTALLAFFVAIAAGQGTDNQGRHFHVLFQMQLFGLAGAFLTGDLFNLFVFFEVLLLASYGLLLHGGGARRVRAGLHYVVLNLLGSIVFLIAAGLLYGVVGTLNLADMAVRVAATPMENVGLVRAAGLLLLGVFALKAALLPVYLWLPAAYANTSAPVAALFAIMTKVGAYSILRMHTLVFGGDAGPLANLYEPWLLPLALATQILGMIGAVAAASLGRMAAYFVIASVGTLLLAFGLGSSDAIAAGLYYLPHSTFVTATFFLLIDALAKRRGLHADKLTVAADMPQSWLWGSLYLALAVLLAGLPPLSGFLGKFLLLKSALDHFWLIPVWVVVLLTALLGLIVLARAGSMLFLRGAAEEGQEATVIRHVHHEVWPIAGLVLLTLGLTVWAGFFNDRAADAASQLLAPQRYVAAVLAPERSVLP